VELVKVDIIYVQASVFTSCLQDLIECIDVINS